MFAERICFYKQIVTPDFLRSLNKTEHIPEYALNKSQSESPWL
jgi:hypothetical protein